MEAKTYTKRENARRAGVAAGVPAELVEITVHKNGDEVRFGWKQMEAPAPAATEPVVTTSKPKKAATPKVERIEQNGVKRPGPGKCLEVWEYLVCCLANRYTFRLWLAGSSSRCGRAESCAGCPRPWPARRIVWGARCARPGRR